MKTRNLVKILFGMPKSLFLNFKYLPIKDAIKLPILVSYNTKLLKLKGEIIINGEIKPGMIKIGIGGSGTAAHLPTAIEIYKGQIIFNGRMGIGGGCQICNSGKLELGENVSFVAECHIICRKHVKIGSNSTISWHTQIMDSDSHNIINKDSKVINENDEIIIGENVWVASKVNILKGASIPSNNIIASGATITKKIDEKNCILTGMPVKVLKRNVSWEF